MKMNRSTWRLVAALLFTLSIFASNRPSDAQQALPEELIAVQQAGATVTLMAAIPVAQSEPDYQALTLSRVVPIPTGEAPIVIAGGQEVWYVESGSLQLTGDAGQVITAEAGEQAVVRDAGQYSVDLRGDSCPSALRLEFNSVIAMKMGSDVAGPELGPDGIPCPIAQTLVQAGQTIAPRPDQAIGFIARVELPAETYLGLNPYTGPVGYAIESGSITLDGPVGANLGLTAGGWAAIAMAQNHWIISAPGVTTSMLMVGALLGDELAVVPTPTQVPIVGVNGSEYVSPSHGYALTWNESWSVAGEFSDAGADTLQLTNGTSQLYVQSYPAYTGDAVTCVQEISDQLKSREGFSNARPRLTADGKPILTGDAQRRVGVYDFTYTSQDGVGDYTESIECRMLPDGAALVITHIVLADAYAAQIDPVRAVVMTIKMP